MTQMNYKIDGRTRDELLTQFEKLARSYVPEWKLDRNDPDIGTTLAELFANQMSLNVKNYNDILDRYHTEFVNLLDISLHKATPAETVVLPELISDSVPGVSVEKGTKFLAETEDGNCYFESDHPVYVTSSKLDSVFMTVAPEGKVIPLKGQFIRTDYAGKREGLPEDGHEEENDTLKPFSMFDPSGEGIEKHALLLYHSRIFDVVEEELYCRIDGNDDLVKDILLGKYRFLYYTEDGFIPVESVTMKDGMLVLVKERQGVKVAIKNEEYGMLVLEAKTPPKENVSIKRISFSSNGKLRMPEYVGNGNTDFEVSGFDLFGDTLSNYSECYIGMDSYFSKQGAKVILSFAIGFGEHMVGYGGSDQPENDEDLKIIKRRSRNRSRQTVVYAGCDDISIEYYNGIGWKRLLCDQEYRSMFADSRGGNGELSFICPSDWEESTVGAYQGRVLKITLQRSDNCYMQPCIHRYPIITNMTVRYSYEQKYEIPQKIVSLYGTASNEISGEALSGKGFAAFRTGNYDGSALYLGFTSPFESGPVSLWWKLKDTHREQNRRLRISYSSPSGFKEMKFIDHTAGLSKTGTMMFLPADDMTYAEYEGRKLCWIRIYDEGSAEHESADIERIELNAIELHNIYTHEEQSLIMESVKAGASFPLYADNILDADVWVNETSELSDEQMGRLMESEPDRVRVNYNYLGAIEEFFVRWDERDNFNDSKPGDRHYCIDRINSRLIFGDGIKVKIPRETNGTAVIVRVRSCDGSKANVEAGMITASDQNILYIGNITNPEPAFGGSDMESIARALQRGVNMISSGGRYVTLSDYRDDILNYSDNIDKAAIVVGTDRYGRSDQERIHIPILMKDYLNGASSFYRMQSELKKHLLAYSEMTVGEEELIIEEPVFVRFNVQVWASIRDIDDSFEVRNQIIDTLTEYLSPISEGYHKGWEIGELPKKTQIAMKLNALKSKAVIRQFMVTASFYDDEGLHEVDIGALKPTPFMVVCSGVHKIHLSKSRNND